MTHMFPGFLTPVSTQLSFQSHRLLFSHASAEMRAKIPQKVRLNLVSNSQPPSHESDILMTDPPGRGFKTLTLSQTSPGFYVSAVQVF